jgi:hypothetical protein
MTFFFVGFALSVQLRDVRRELGELRSELSTRNHALQRTLRDEAAPPR